MFFIQKVHTESCVVGDTQDNVGEMASKELLIKVSFKILGRNDTDFYEPSKGTILQEIEKPYLLLGKTLPFDIVRTVLWKVLDKQLSDIVVPYGIETMGASVLEGYLSVRTVNLPNTMRFIEQAAFKNCDYLKQVKLGENLINIEPDAFWGCSALCDIVLPDGLCKLGDGAFYDCWSLPTVRIPDTVTFVGVEVFAECKRLVEAKLSAKMKCVPVGMFFGCSSLREVEIPQGIIEICSYAFRDCVSLTTITIPSTVKNISELAFHGSALRLVRCVKGSKADKWARKHKFSCEYINE